MVKEKGYVTNSMLLMYEYCRYIILAMQVKLETSIPFEPRRLLLGVELSFHMGAGQRHRIYTINFINILNLDKANK